MARVFHCLNIRGRAVDGGGGGVGYCYGGGNDVNKR